MGSKVELDFTVEEWADAGRHERILRTVATATNLIVAHAALDASIGCYPRSRLILRHGARVIRDTHPPTPADLAGR